MCHCIDFTAQLAEKFPWNNMEKEVNGKIFEKVFFAEENELFWVRLNEVLELHKEDNPLRCAEILDFIGRYANHRPNEVTLSHYKNADLSALTLQYLESAVRQKMPLSVLQCLIILDIAFECSNQRNQKGYERCVAVWRQLLQKNIQVKNAIQEREYLHNYSYLWRNKSQYEAFASAFDLL